MNKCLLYINTRTLYPTAIMITHQYCTTSHTNPGTEVRYFAEPFLCNIVKTVWIINGEAQQ